MKLVLLGTGGYHPSELRHTACLMLPELGIVLDAGTAMYRVRDQLATDTLDIFLTHAHLDHVIGLTYLFDVLRDRQMKRVRVFGDAEKLAAVQQHVYAPLLFPAKPTCDFIPLTDTVDLPENGRLTHFPLEHPGGVVGYRLDWPGHSMAYVTDTTARSDADYVPLIHGVDVLIHECYFPDGFDERARLTGHSCTTPVAQVARAAAVGRLILVHVNPLSTEEDPIGIDVAREIFSHTELGVDRLEIVF